MPSLLQYSVRHPPLHYTSLSSQDQEESGGDDDWGEGRELFIVNNDFQLRLQPVGASEGRLYNIKMATDLVKRYEWDSQGYKTSTSKHKYWAVKEFLDDLKNNHGTNVGFNISSIAE